MFTAVLLCNHIGLQFNPLKRTISYLKALSPSGAEVVNNRKDARSHVPSFL